MITMKSREFFVCVLLQRTIRKAYIIRDKKRSPINGTAPEKGLVAGGGNGVGKGNLLRSGAGGKKRVPTGGV